MYMDRSIFTQKEWELLRAAPFNVQMLVSQADGERELEEIFPLVEILMSYKGDVLIEDIFKDTVEAVEEDRLDKNPREALDDIEKAIELINVSCEKKLILEETKNIFFHQLIRIAEQTANVDSQGIEPQELSIINLIKSKIN